MIHSSSTTETSDATIGKIPANAIDNRFYIPEGNSHNYFYQNNNVSAHILVTGGDKSSILVNFPAGDSGAGLFFDICDSCVPAMEFTITEGPDEYLGEGNVANVPNLIGIRFEVSVNRKNVSIRHIVLDSIRHIRHYKDFEIFRSRLQRKQEFMRTLNYPQEWYEEPYLNVTTRGSETVYSFYTKTLDNKNTYFLEITTPGNVQSNLGEEGNLILSSRNDEPVRFRLATAVDFKPLTPFSIEELLSDESLKYREQLAASPEKRTKFDNYLRAFQFLAYREKFLAGSWRFLTYFGRDTMMSLLMLRDSIRPEVYESAMQSVLDRISDEGQVAHEEDIGSQAIYVHTSRYVSLEKEGRHDEAEEAKKFMSDPVFDYKMVDDDFMFALMLNEYMADDSLPEERKSEFLERKDVRGRKNLDVILKNISYVIQKTEAFKWEQTPSKLVRINYGLTVGNWRDSVAGLGWGVYPGDINVFLVPNCLRAIKSLLFTSPLGKKEVRGTVRGEEAVHIEKILDYPVYLDELIQAWQDACKLFTVHFTSEQLRQVINNYIPGTRELSRSTTGRTDDSPRQGGIKGGVHPDSDFQSPVSNYYLSKNIDSESTIGEFLEGATTPEILKQGITFYALSLKENGSPVEVMNSDTGYELFFGTPSPVELREILATYNLPFPIGLAERGGILVSNPTYAADISLRKTLNNKAYHGAVVWAWHHSLIIKGLIRQLHRFGGDTEDSKQIHSEILATIRHILSMEEASGNLINSELWTHSFKDGTMEPTAYGADEESETTSNAVQLWSSVGLSVMQVLNRERIHL